MNILVLDPMRPSAGLPCAVPPGEGEGDREPGVEDEGTGDKGRSLPVRSVDKADVLGRRRAGRTAGRSHVPQRLLRLWSSLLHFSRILVALTRPLTQVIFG